MSESSSIQDSLRPIAFDQFFNTMLDFDIHQTRKGKPAFNRHGRGRYYPKAYIGTHPDFGDEVIVLIDDPAKGYRMLLPKGYQEAEECIESESVIDPYYWFGNAIYSDFTLTSWRLILSDKKVVRKSSAGEKGERHLLILLGKLTRDKVDLCDKTLVDIPLLLSNYLNHLKSLPEWRDLSDTTRAVYYQRVLQHEWSNTHAITLRFSNVTIKKAMSNSKGPMDYIRRRLEEKFKQKLTGSADYWFTLEISAAGNLHLHGAISLLDNDIQSTKDALHAVNENINPAFKNKAVRIDQIYDGIGWAAYATEDFRKTRKHITKGNLLTCSKSLKEPAKKLYELERDFINNLCRKT